MMNFDTILVALVSLAGTIIGAFSGMRLVTYRIDQLEKTVSKHNSVIERVFCLEGKMREVEHDISDLKNRDG